MPRVYLDGRELGLRFSACHVIPGHGKCGRLHGHTYHVSVELLGERTEPHGFVYDFDELKSTVRELIKPLDHRVLLPTESELFEIEESGNEITVRLSDGKRYVFPREDVVLIPTRSLSAEDLAEYLADELERRLAGDNLKELRVRVDEGWGQGAEVVRRLD
ncbi:TPA: 6-pyruvoyl tetrahydropterin synthase family protein [Methanopyrus kandleri]|uniref:6-pyruvoyl-tetrahydropterin synthase n=2 Tax=Methanopyrus kandleri TaxID=2320 RepID=Q8TX57_METKA|nr:6-pyruvoyl-tetrahydropterin synthase [Methanopyrus kandleri AV19]HII69953.1 6-pyruvoyl tetrahydropterin synthase family protein [Methanopyrus kandleri]